MTTTQMRPSEYRGPIKWLGGSAIAAVVIGVLFRLLSPVVFPPGVRDQVIVLAVPFVGIFAALILLFILSITLASVRFRKIVPLRTHRPVELLTIAGILLGIFALFQPFHRGPYTFGFGLLLLSTLAYIFWSHIEPRTAKTSTDLPAFGRRSKLVGAVAGLAAAILVFGMLAVAAVPSEPYGLFPRQYARMSEAEQQAAAEQALVEYRYAYLPFLALYSAIPGLIVFLLAREAVVMRGGEEEERAGGAAPAST